MRVGSVVVTAATTGPGLDAGAVPPDFWTVSFCAVATAAAALIKSDEILSFLSAPLLLAGAGLVLTTLYPIYRSIVLGSAESPTPLAGR